jgi:hypothetical protein
MSWKDIGIKIAKGEEVNHGAFETEIIGICNRRGIEYHFCEIITKVFMEDRRWEEVFPAWYGDMPKYKNNDTI